MKSNSAFGWLMVLALSVGAPVAVAGEESGEPAFNYDPAAVSGCSNFLVWAQDVKDLQGAKEALWIKVNARALGLLPSTEESVKEVRLVLDEATANVTVGVDQRGEGEHIFNFCNDVAQRGPSPKLWGKAVAGTLEIRAEYVRPGFRGPIYRVSLELTDAVFAGEVGEETATLNHWEAQDILVGWLPG